jgi:hypothetical protein
MVLLEQSSHRLGYLGEIWDKTTIVASQPKKTSNFMNGSRCLPIQNFLYFSGIYRNSITRQYMTEERYSLQLEFTFAKLGIEFMFSQSG